MGCQQLSEVIDADTEPDWILGVIRWDEKAGSGRDAVYAPKVSTCSSTDWEDPYLL